jgi:UDP-N-acetyl-D-glucosamine dehydrogenase
VGVAYKRDIDDIRESPSLDVMDVLRGRGAHVAYTDPYVPHLSARAWAGDRDLSSVEITPQALASFDCVVIVTDHTGIDYDVIMDAADLVVDSRNAVKRHAPHVFRLGAPAPALAATDREPEPAVAQAG